MGRIVWFGVVNGPATAWLAVFGTVVFGAFAIGTALGKAAALEPIRIPVKVPKLVSPSVPRFASKVGNTTYYWV